LRGHPPEHLLFDHLKESLSIYRVHVNLCLQSTVLHRPWHWLSNHAIRPELCEALVHGIKNGFVENVLAFLLERRRLECKRGLG
jgi:hypothetical protein